MEQRVSDVRFPLDVMNWLLRDWLKRLGDLFNLKNESQIDLVRPEKEAEQAVPPKSDRAGG